MTNAPTRGISECIEELAATRLADATPAAAAAAAAALLQDPAACRSAATIQQLTLAVRRHLALPAQLPSAARAALLRLQVAPRLGLRRVAAGAQVSEDTEMLWLLNGDAHTLETSGEARALMHWAAIHPVALTGSAERCVHGAFALQPCSRCVALRALWPSLYGQPRDALDAMQVLPHPRRVLLRLRAA